ncbi:MAG TPA: methyltransferase domain-containing protein [Phycisphaerae bacterium]|nr:methyltransferase domain-containing protein [Phycisphaerae bacterium]
MTMLKLFGEPRHCDAAFYAGLPLADHINQPEHALRLYVAAAYVLYYARFAGCTSVSDLGCGNGGLLEHVGRSLGPDVRLRGYDLLPANVADARARGLSVELRDLVAEPLAEGERPDLAVMTQTLEHLLDPEAFLRNARHLVVATVPCNENAERHYGQHLWAWTGGSFGKMFLRAGFQVLVSAQVARVQLVVAGRNT